MNDAELAEAQRLEAERTAKIRELGQFLAGLAGVIWALKVILGKR